MIANYFEIICKKNKADDKVIWHYRSETICPDTRITLKEIVARILYAMDILHNGRKVDLSAMDYDEYAKSVIKDNK